MCASESDESDVEGGMGNMSHVIIRPPNESGKAKRGHLCFDASFETGNLGRVSLVGNFEYDLFLRPDTCNPRFRFWFNFTVRNIKKDQCVIFNVVNLSKEYNLFNSHLTPWVKSSSRPNWQHLPRKNVFYYRSPVHRQRYVLSFAFNFDKEDDVYQFAVAPPYSYSKLQCYLKALEENGETQQRFVRSVLCKTLQNRNLDLITIDHVTGRTKETKRMDQQFLRVIIIICRSHPCETPTSFICQGFLEFLIGNHRMAEILRTNFVFKIVPMMNPDGVFLGNNRCNLVGQDMNRVWHVATEFSHPTIHAVKNMFKELDDSDHYQIDFIVDLHAHSGRHGCFIYGNSYDDVYRYERHRVFPRLFSVNAEGFVAQNMMFNTDVRKLGSARRFCCEHLSDAIDSYTLQVSMGGHYIRDCKTVAFYNEGGYYRCGRNLARTFFQYYQFINVLPISLLSELNPPRRQLSGTCQARSRLKIRQDMKSRSSQTRRLAHPISYKNLFICHDSKHAPNEDCQARGALQFNGAGNSGERELNWVSKCHSSDKFPVRPIKFEKHADFKSNSVITQPCHGSRSKISREKLYENAFNCSLKQNISIINLNLLTRCAISNKFQS